MDKKVVFKLTLLILFSFWSSLSIAKYQVCSITINSADEIEVFKDQLGTRDFDFVELVPLSVESRPNDVHWFTDACNKGYRCDILVVSGHFGGLFFGEKHSYILPVDTMEKMACSNACSGVLSNVKEVFLFGCYTLANKRSRQRTPQQHLDVLLRHQYARDMAEIVVAAIYLPFGLSFQSQMQLIFPDQSSIYGFTELSPLGKDIRWPLRNYFRAINKYYGNYKSYLDQKIQRPQAKNPLIYSTIGGAVSEVKGIGPNNDQFPHLQKMCRLYDSNVDQLTGMQTISEMMDSGEGSKAYQAIKHFVSERGPFTGESSRLFDGIKDNPNFKNEFYILYNQIGKNLPYVRVQFLNFLKFFKWVSDSFYKEELKSNVLKMVHRPTSEGHDFATALVYDEKIPMPLLNLNTKDFRPDFYQGIWSALILEVLNVQDYLVHRRLMNTCLSRITKDPVVCYQILKSLGHLRVNDSLIIDKMEAFLAIPHSGLLYYSMYGLAYAGIQRKSVHLSIAKHFNYPDEWVQLQAIRSVGLLKSKYAQVIEQLIARVEGSKDEKIVYEGLHSLRYMVSAADPVHLDSIRQLIVKGKLHEHSNEEIKRLARSF